MRAAGGVLKNRGVEAAEPSYERPRRRIAEWALVAALALTALVLGYVGFSKVYAGQGYGPSELLYRSLQLFVLESGAVQDTSVPLSLQIARILAPALAAYAAIRAIVLLFGEQLALVGLRFRLRDHVVVAGLGRKGFALAKALRAAGERVVVIERDGGNTAAAGCRARGIPVLFGDAADRELLLKANAPRARALVVVAGDDRTNIDIAFGVAALPFGRTPRLPGFVHVDDLVLWRLLQPQVLALQKRLPLRLEFFNVHAEAARVLLDERPLEPASRPHLLVVGPSPLADSLIVHAARTWRSASADGEPLRITVAGRAAATQREALLDRYPGLEEICELGSWELGLESHEGPRTPPDAAYVCLAREAEGLAAALLLGTYAETRHVPTLLAVDDEQVGVASAIRKDASLAHLIPFGVLSRTMTAHLIGHGTNELLARAKHEHYVEMERERGQTVADNPSMVPWEQLDETLKESNRLFADSVSDKLDASSCVVVPAPLADPQAPGFAFSEAEVEELARAEHDRWCRDLAREGWQPGNDKDPRRKLHPKLVPWSELTEEDREKDRDPVRSLPELLARLGFEIRRAA